MDEKYQQLIEALAAKLGTTAEHLWGVLVRQAPISGAVDLAVMVAWVVGIVMFARLVQRKATTPPETPENKYPRAEWNDEVGVGMAWAAVVLVGLVAAIIIGSCLSTVVAALVNPEYWALKQLIR